MKSHYKKDTTEKFIQNKSKMKGPDSKLSMHSHIFKCLYPYSYEAYIQKKMCLWGGIPISKGLETKMSMKDDSENGKHCKVYWVAQNYLHDSLFFILTLYTWVKIII